MKLKSLLLLLVASSLFGYLEWGGGNSSFLFEAEYEVLIRLFNSPESASHPFTLIPLAGQVLLLISLILYKPKKILIYIGIACLGLLLYFMFVMGLFSLNLKIIGSTLPFTALSIYTIWYLRKMK
ncbi:MAG: hypothetical protein CMB80_32580 [Flammeovirgaceae bacterium]|nr:hypothetical protein [Flammeovirgaceae bacterium]MBE61404.1 hypothetical protein [Flammeovirgaceae bacterium]MBR09786.1 hypothetical protein [Rickettsiales bacterium]HCX21705.1 hypothetical protein [Cytophagales bacterium]|tara:strand:- start:106 stop:480 length:375 start_codon:yes stop_codon:yes gene_type:complete